KNMLEGSEPIGVETVKHIDRCLSCLACMTTCPSGVNYMHLVDHGRRHIEAHYRRPWAERLLRYSLGRMLTRPRLMRAALHAARLAKPFAALLPKPLRPLVALAPSTLPAPSPTIWAMKNRRSHSPAPILTRGRKRAQSAVSTPSSPTPRAAARC